MTLAEALAHPKARAARREARSRRVSRVAELLGISWEEARDLAPQLREATLPRDRAPVEEEAPRLEERDRYVRNRDSGTYVFTLAGQARDVVLSEARVDAMVRDYSAAVDKPATINEIVRVHGLTRPVVRGVLHALGVTHDSLPWTPERIAEATEDELAEEAGQLRAQGIYRRIEREKWRAIEADAQRWRRAREELLQPILGWLAEHAPRYAPPIVRIPIGIEPWALVVGLTDEHWGVQARGWTREQHRARYLALLQRVLADVAHLGRPERVIVPIGSDGLHVDTATRTTTAGTRVETDAPAAELLTSWVAYKTEQIDTLRALGPVELWVLPGNHDSLLAVAAGEILAAWYREAPDVAIVRCPTSTPATLYGQTLVALSHGDSHKARELAEVIARRHAEAWGRARWRVCYVGHYHSEADIATRSDLRVLRWPTAAPPDAWHEEQGYEGGWRGLAAEVVYRDRGPGLRVLATAADVP